MADASAIRWDQNVKCDLCGSKDHESLRKDERYGYTFVRCRGCGLMFYNPRYEEQYVIETFLRAGDAQIEAQNMVERGVFFGDPEGGPEHQKKALQDYYRFILKEHTGWYNKLNGGRAPDSMFEVGSSVGWYMKVAREDFLKGPKGPLVQGCDANVYSAEEGQRAFGLDIRDGSFLGYNTTPEQMGRFALATMLDYIEHTYTPFQDLKKMRDMTAPHGVLLLKTFLEEMDPQGLFVQPVFHSHHFTAITLRRAIEDAGWKIHVFDMERDRVHGLVTVYAERLP